MGPGVDAEAGADPGTTISGLSDTGVSPGRRFQPLILGLAVAIWALTHFTGHDSRDPSGLTLAHQPGHSSASGCELHDVCLPLLSRWLAVLSSHSDAACASARR